MAMSSGDAHNSGWPAIKHIGGWRGSAVGARDGGAWREWMHFCVLHEGLLLLVNLSQARDSQSSSTCIVMACAEDWRGSLTHVAGPGGIWRGTWRSEIAGARCRETDDGVHLEIDGEDISLSLRMVPICSPSLASDLDLGFDQTLSWLVVPRWRATGHVRYSGRTSQVMGALAYHDHNWGNFRWDTNFSWEWAFALSSEAEGAWSVVVVRVGDRARHRTFLQAVFVWRGAEEVRLFRNRAIDIRSWDIFHAAGPLHTIPRGLALCVPGRATPLPGRVQWTARHRDDGIDVEIVPQCVARVVLPSAIGTAPSILHEVKVETHVKGSIGGEVIDFSAPSIMESYGQ